MNPDAEVEVLLEEGHYRQKADRSLASAHRVLHKPAQERHTLPFFLLLDLDADVELLLKEDEAETFKIFIMREIYIEKAIPAKIKPSTSIKYSDLPANEKRYDPLLGSNSRKRQSEVRADMAKTWWQVAAAICEYSHYYPSRDMIRIGL
jgi:hypothetical protein